MRRVAIGVDPDLHHTGWAIVSQDDGLEACGVVTVPGCYKEAQAAIQMVDALDWHLPVDRYTVGVVESQQVYRAGNRRIDPKGLILIATVAGGALAAMCGGDSPTLLLPTPRQWKGSVPKAIHQARTLKALGDGWKFSRPSDNRKGLIVLEYPEGIWEGEKKPTKTDWKHVLDAIGLAIWGLKHS